MDADQMKQYENARRIKEHVEADLLSRLGVRGVGIGFKQEKGKPTERLAIRVTSRIKPTCRLRSAFPGPLRTFPPTSLN